MRFDIITIEQMIVFQILPINVYQINNGISFSEF